MDSGVTVNQPLQLKEPAGSGANNNGHGLIRASGAQAYFGCLLHCSLLVLPAQTHQVMSYNANAQLHLPHFCFQTPNGSFQLHKWGCISQGAAFAVQSLLGIFQRSSKPVELTVACTGELNAPTTPKNTAMYSCWHQPQAA
jgi:hypothetical protein